MYHPLQHKKQPRTPGSSSGGPLRRISSPDIKVNSLRRAGHQENTGGDSRKRIVRRGSFQGTLKGSGGRGSEVHPGRAHSVATVASPLYPPSSHWTTQPFSTGEGGGGRGGGGGLQKETTSTGGHHYHHPTPSELRGGSGSAGVSTGTANLQEAHLRHTGSQASSCGGGGMSPGDSASSLLRQR